MTKVYIKNFNPVCLKEKIELLNKYKINEKNFIEVISPDGIFQIENNRIYKLKPVDLEVKNETFENNTLLFDKSYYEKEEVFSQIPYNNIERNITSLHYATSNTTHNTFVELIVEGIYEEVKTISNSYDKYLYFKPVHFYFMINDSLDNILIKKELNVFLSILK